MGTAWTDRQMSWEDYTQLFDHLLPEVDAATGPAARLLALSPHSPHGDRTDYNNPTCGDAHLWDVWHGRKPSSGTAPALTASTASSASNLFPNPKRCAATPSRKTAM